MLEQILGITALVLMGVWVIAMLVTQIVYLIASFKASVGLTLLSFIVPFLGLYVLIKFWEDLKKPFLNQLVVAFGGFVLFLGGGMALQAMGIIEGVPQGVSMERTTDTTPVNTPPVQEITTIEQPAGVTPADSVRPATPVAQPERPVTPPSSPAPIATSREVPIRDMAIMTVPHDWYVMPWKLPDLALAMGDPQRGEFVTVQAFDKNADQPFAEFTKSVQQAALEHIIEGKLPAGSRKQTIHGCEVVTVAMGGRSRLPEQVGHQVSARLSTVDGVFRRYLIVQWRTVAWDAQTVQTFDRLLSSFDEIDGE